jgi:hypothetical protein
MPQYPAFLAAGAPFAAAVRYDLFGDPFLEYQNAFFN